MLPDGLRKDERLDVRQRHLLELNHMIHPT